MSARLFVLAPGMLTTVQDRGRPGYEHMGVPPSGAMDPGALRLANALAGNPGDLAALEFTVTGGRLRVLDADCTVAFAGSATLHVSAASGLPASKVAPWQSHRVPAGATLTIGPLERGMRGYLAVCGGIAVDPVLGSASTLTRAVMGGIEGRALKRDDVLAIGRARARTQRRWVPLRHTAWFYRDAPIGVILGPQQDHFSTSEIRGFLSATYRLAPQSDRMGLRLDGPTIAHARGADIITDPIAAGSIQIPGAGQPLIAMNDRQTTGGYPKIATVISADLPRLAQMRPGQPLRFEAMDAAGAVERLRADTQWLDARERELRADPNFPIFPLLFP
ncbi:biotin-dependent carboxyltransferase family protein [Achromobacter piechaudii]|uniref:5-oxoprolinase subunit C n=1 Tax=Achromobacter piechaudii TaxID=72556 RepID=A0A6S7D1Q0_9BURK|nr:biotin-dependent carboxyltransferase family protein [Achromobacter piechaudii]CAB3828425.1 5-oxoprolinase subunit C [Achromobacter piechaudii]